MKTHKTKTFVAFPDLLTPLTDEEFDAEKLPEEWRGLAYWETVPDDGALGPTKRLQILS